MDSIDIPDLAQALVIFWGTAKAYFAQPWTFYQILIVALCYATGWLISRKVEPWLESRARTIKGKPGLLRVIIAVMRRSHWVIFLLLLTIARLVTLELTWPSRTYLMALALALGWAWLTISVSSRIIHNRTVSRLIALTIFIYVALGILDLRPEATAFLDQLAIQLGDLRISVLFVLRTVIITAGFLWLASLLGNFFDSRINVVEDLSPSFKVLAGKVIKISFIVIAVMMALSSTGIDLTALTIFSGAVGVGLGFGLQKVVSNFISGVIILMDRSIKPGDTITLGETFGWIRELRARFVSVITRDGREYLIPNEDFITQQVVNWSFSDDFIRLDVDFGVAYDSDPHQVSRIAIEAAKSVGRVVPSKTPVCWMTAFGASSLDFKLRFWIRDPQAGLTNVRGQVLLALWDAFRQAGISIPFPHREIIMRTPVEVVRRDGPAAQAGGPGKRKP
ncbi:mechanosensitive ion channel [Hoeflea sp. YIM 152468]|uniref:mechanosensitive ion channel family protein n=1 Tax=Hoeflea sp. YIM 152468 TaxID=3031759 RepID=UPI0023DBA033|nr:mechanosensitive ion channel domain-containing protein [Hoeflea sp. YIM 152468]MDF1609637.1 mechanosensitive ion channel [Hoeflea sp. YIM 152468]